MRPIETFIAVPSLPARLERLRELAYNLRWSWDHDTINLFRHIDRELWETSGHNPVLMLRTVKQERLDELAEDGSFLDRLDHVCESLDEYLAATSTWFERHDGVEERPFVAYFSAEFGLTECLSIFAGGLGVLAGDHIKSSSDLDIPLVGVGLLYHRGYFRQRLDASGRQQERPWLNEFENLPIQRELDADGNPLTIGIQYPGRQVMAQIWRADVGRTSVYLLDANLEENDEADRQITGRLYDSSSDMRIKQEIMLGIGGYRALEALGIAPSVIHINEGHAAFVTLERARKLMAEEGLTFNEAREVVAAGTVFTTHTPVAAGHDRFEPETIDHFLGDYYAALNLSRNEFLALGREHAGNEAELFTMTILALRMSSISGGVSKLHGEVTRQMWREIWPNVPEQDVPITSVTNGVHLPSWVSEEIAHLYDKYLGPTWREEPGNTASWQAIQSIPADELWSIHEHRRERLIHHARVRVAEQRRQRGARQSEVDEAANILNPAALTIGFARRFATYKRGTLLLRDKERLARLLNDTERPVQFIFAGKAHPRDDEAKELIRQFASTIWEEPFRNRIIFLEDYDMAIARFLVQGVDVWLNNPRRPLEASGTSGMKAAANGGLNLSVLDGWWDEAWKMAGNGEIPIGWPIGSGEVYEDFAYADEVEAEALYTVLENEVIPAFYERGEDNLPHGWITRMRASMQTLCPFFNTNRMLREYTERFYVPAFMRHQRLAADGSRAARELAAWKAKLAEDWRQVSVQEVNGRHVPEIVVGTEVPVQARVHLGNLSPDDVEVQFYVGRINSSGEIVDATSVQMKRVEDQEDGWYRYEATQRPSETGRYGYTIRVLPKHPDLESPFIPGLITWVESN